MANVMQGASCILSLSLSVVLSQPLTGQQVVDLPGADRGLAVTLEEVFSVGSMGGEEWETFSAVNGVAFDGAGNLYVLDRQNFRVVKVGPDGELVGEMGRSGGGPGEFSAPLALAVTRTGEVRVYDLGRQGFTVFNPDGSFDSTARIRGADFFLPTGGLMTLPDGRMVDGGAGGNAMMVVGDIGDPAAPRPVHLLTPGDREVGLDEAFQGWNPLSAIGADPEESLSAGGFHVSAPPLRAFDPGLFVGVLTDGRLAVSDSSAYAVKLLEPGGSVERILRRPFSPRPVTRRDQSDERERQLNEIAAREESGGTRAHAYSSDGSSGSIAVGGGQVSDLLRARVESMGFGREVPVIAGLVVDWADRIWVERTGDRVGEKGPIDILSPTGEYLGSLAPGELSIPDAFGPYGLAAWVEEDELDVPMVVVRRIRIQ